jgi:hypothetical protein
MRKGGREAGRQGGRWVGSCGTEASAAGAASASAKVAVEGVLMLLQRCRDSQRRSKSAPDSAGQSGLPEKLVAGQAKAVVVRVAGLAHGPRRG